jgi:tellurite resistance protein
MTDLWHKYRKSDKQTIVIVGVLILSAKLCKADGEFTEIEKEEILKIVPHEKFQHTMLLEILHEGEIDQTSIQEHARRLRKLVGDTNKKFLEFVVAVLYRLAIVDHVMSEEEIRDIHIVALEFGVIKVPLSDQIKEIALKFKDKLRIDKWST